MTRLAFATIVCLMIVCPQSVPAVGALETTDIVASANQWVTSAFPDSVQANVFLTVTNTDFSLRKTCYAFVRFDLSQLPDTEIASATLFMYSTILQEGPFGFPTWNITVSFCSNTTWDETTLTWNNMPAMESDPLDYALIHQEYLSSSWDLTSTVADVISAGGTAMTVVLKSAKFMSDDWLNFCGREYDTEENRPILRVQHAVVTTATAEPSTTTSTGTTGQGTNGAFGSLTVVGMVGAGALVLVIIALRKRSS